MQFNTTSSKPGFYKVCLLRDVILKTTPLKYLGVMEESLKEGEGDRRSNSQRIKAIGENLVALGQYRTIKEAFQAISKSF